MAEAGSKGQEWWGKGPRVLLREKNGYLDQSVKAASWRRGSESPPPFACFKFFSQTFRCGLVHQLVSPGPQSPPPPRTCPGPPAAGCARPPLASTVRVALGPLCEAGGQSARSQVPAAAHQSPFRGEAAWALSDGSREKRAVTGGPGACRAIIAAMKSVKQNHKKRLPLRSKINT